ncbi:hypothetical protein CCP3SC5AM1_880005 [Gammaproteobacteria bacterium]
MISKDIDLLLNEIGAFQAEYKPISKTKPVGCALPAFINGVPDFPALAPPDIEKSCTPPFIEFPVVIDPFPIPESCPEGITFNASEGGIFSSTNDTESSGTLSIGAVRNEDDPCAYDLVIPDLVIPCYPNGPKFFGSALITVKDLNRGVTDTTRIKLTQNDEEVCKWIMEGNLTITIPCIPCPNGITFGQTTMQITSTCPNVIENKLVSLVRNQNNPCQYDLSMPELQIPCYPDGPNIHGGVTITTTDRGDVVETQTADFLTNPGCCDYELGGTINIEVPCQEGIKFTTRSLIVSNPAFIWKPLLDPDNNSHIIQLPPQTLVITAKKDPDICSWGLDFPELVIPCSPDGVNLEGHLRFVTSDGNDSNFIDFAQARLTDKPCSWDFGNIQVDLPTPYCPGGFTFDRDPNGLVIRINSSEQVDYVDPFSTAGHKRYQNLRLQRLKEADPNSDDCGALLTGEINLGLAAFTYNCDRLSVGSKQGDFVLSFDPDKPATTNNITKGKLDFKIGLAPSASGCGFEFSNQDINVPVLACPDGFKYDGQNGAQHSDLVVKVGGGAPINHTVKIAPISNTSPQCGLKVSGVLDIPVGNVGGFNKRDWNFYDTFSNGDVASLVFPEGARYTFYANAGAIAAGIIPSSTRDNGVWQCLGGSGPKVFPPFKVIKCREDKPSTATDPVNVKSLVKVVPRSFLYHDIKNTTYLPIHGLDTPFELGQNEKIYLEIVFDAAIASLAAPRFVYAAICKGDSWDEPEGPVADVVNQQYKVIRPTDAESLYIGTYAELSGLKMIGVDDTTRDSLVNQQLDVLERLSKIEGNRPRQLKAWILIAQTKDGKNVDEPGALDEIDEETVAQSSMAYPIQQMLSSHLILTTRNADNVPIVVPEIAHGGVPNNIQLSKPVLTTALTGIDEVQLTFTVAPTEDANHIVHNLGVYGDDIHVYYTTDGSIPTINTWENPLSLKYDTMNSANNLIKVADIKGGIAFMAVCSSFTRSFSEYVPLSDIV